jgi:phosphoglycolate phosphatase
MPIHDDVMPSPSPYPLVVFDFDGTLVESKEGISRAMNEALVDLGLPMVEPERVHALIGLALDDVIRPLLDEPPSPELFQAIRDRYRVRFIALAKETTRVFDGIAEGLDALRDRGVRLAIATGKSLDGLERTLGELGLRDRFEFLGTADQVKNGKPAADMLELCLAETGVPVAEALMVGDTSFDVEMAQAAGVDSCAVTWGTHDEASLKALNPTFLVHSVEALFSLLR